MRTCTTNEAWQSFDSWSPRNRPRVSEDFKVLAKVTQLYCKFFNRLLNNRNRRSFLSFKAARIQTAAACVFFAVFLALPKSWKSLVNYAAQMQCKQRLSAKLWRCNVICQLWGGVVFLFLFGLFGRNEAAQPVPDPSFSVRCPVSATYVVAKDSKSNGDGTVQLATVTIFNNQQPGFGSVSLVPTFWIRLQYLCTKKFCNLNFHKFSRATAVY